MSGMKSKLLLLIFCHAALPLRAAQFRNLGFEETDPSGVDPFSYQGPANQILPGWQVFNGANELTTIGYNFVNAARFPGYVTISNADNWPGAGGKYFLSVYENFQNSPPFTIQQRGDIPATGRYLSLDYQGLGFAVSIDGQLLRAVGNTAGTVPSLGPATVTYDISEFTGRQDALLSLTSFTIFGGPDDVVLDNLVFAVPEPGTNALLALGGAALLGQGRRGRKRKAPALTKVSS